MYRRSTLAITGIVLVLLFIAGVGSAESPRYGGTFVFGRGADSVSLDPINVTDGESLIVTRQIFDGLLQYNEKNTSVEPALAVSWTVSKDEKVWTFKLRQGVKFHDGTPFNAEAVKFNFERWKDPKNPYHQGAFEYYSYMFVQGETDLIKSVDVVDDYTIRFVLERPLAPFLANLAMTPFAIASPAAIKKYGADVGNHPVGTGPFKFVRWDHGDKIIIERNDAYWGGKPYLDKVIFRSIPDNSARFMELESGSIDIMDGMSPDDVKLAGRNKALQVILRPSFNVGYMSMHMDKKPFDNIKVRKAIAHAINKPAIIKAFFAGLAEVAKNPMPPSLWGYNDKVKDYEYDPAKAKSLLAEAGYPNGFETTLWAMPVPRPYMPQPQKIAEAIQADLAAVGIKVKIVSYDWATYLDKIAYGEHDMCLIGWIGDNGDPDNFIYVLFAGSNAVPGRASNYSFYKNDKVDEMLVKAQTVSDQATRTKLYEDVQQLIHDDCPWVPLVHSTPPLSAKKEVMGYIPHPTGSESFRKVWINR
ncbi:MAG: ABC transporter substrate-binding protein [Bacillota bacterium]|nr:ABC transporter substrate-binding protein [Bacillota bacterium]